MHIIVQDSKILVVRDQESIYSTQNKYIFTILNKSSRNIGTLDQEFMNA